MKNFNIILSILLLCTTSSIFTVKTTTKTSARTRRRTPAKRPTRTPIAKRQPVIQQEEPLQEAFTLRYSEILSTLKQKTPDSSDISTLRNIKTEVERQINQIESLFARRIDPIKKQPSLQQAEIAPMNPDATRLVAANIQEIISDLFPVQRGKQSAIIITIAKNFIALHPKVDQLTGVDILYNAIMSNREISARFTTTPTTREIIRDTINTAWVIASF